MLKMVLYKDHMTLNKSYSFQTAKVIYTKFWKDHQKETRLSLE